VMKLEPVAAARATCANVVGATEARGETERLASQLIRDHLKPCNSTNLPHLSKQIGVGSRDPGGGDSIHSHARSVPGPSLLV
jgi:hypothetical protein